MAQPLVRHLDPAVKDALQRRAQRHGRSMEEEVRLILPAAAAADNDDNTPTGGLGSRMAALCEEVGLEEPIQEWRGFRASPADFP